MSLSEIVYSKIVCFTLISGLLVSLQAQRNDAEAALYNIGIGVAFSSVGALINREPGQPIKEVLLKSVWQGALGGYLTFESKRLVRMAAVQQQWGYYWPAKLVNAAGTSIKENAAANKNFWEKWHINIGFSRIEFCPYNTQTFRMEIMPVALFYAVNHSFVAQFDVIHSLRTGEFVWITYPVEPFNYAAMTTAGQFMYNSYLYNEATEAQKFETATHEIIHLYQSNDFSVINTWFKKPKTLLTAQYKLIRWLDKYFYLEFHYIPLRLLYLNEYWRGQDYFENFFEREAFYWSNPKPPYW